MFKIIYSRRHLFFTYLYALQTISLFLYQIYYTLYISQNFIKKQSHHIRAVILILHIYNIHIYIYIKIRYRGERR